MELRSINYFVAIAELGNISAAAVKLGIAHPALTRHIKQLEGELNTILFTRDTANTGKRIKSADFRLA